jgi:hypothetical protein
VIAGCRAAALHRRMRTRSLALLVVLALAAPAALAVAGRKADLRLLERLRRVDGSGSGLDADTVRGLSPEQMEAVGGAGGGLDAVAKRLDAVEAKLAALPGGGPAPDVSRAQLYAHARRATLDAGTSQHLYADCDDPSDLALSCAGGAFAGAHESPITWMGVVEGDGTTTVDRCLVVVTAGSSAPTTDIEAVVRCLARP